MKIINESTKLEFLNFSNIEIISSTNFTDKTVVILGNFDGVHLGHLELINKAIEKAKNENLQVVLYTFLEYPKKKDTIITTLSEKIYILNKIEGIDFIYLDEFENVKNMTAKRFCDDVLMSKLNAKEIFCGFNYTFGYNKEGNSDYLIKNYSDTLNINVINPVMYNFSTSEVKVVKEEKLNLYLNKGFKLISSTFIKSLIEVGKIADVNRILGHNYTLMGVVVEGKKLARTLGFPTANICSPDRKYPLFAVYGSKVMIQGDEKLYFGVMNIGKNPTVENEGVHIETHIFDFSDYIYGKIILIELLENIRVERKMRNLDELKEQISKDKEQWRNIINEKY